MGWGGGGGVMKALLVTRELLLWKRCLLICCDFPVVLSCDNSVLILSLVVYLRRGRSETRCLEFRKRVK